MTDEQINAAIDRIKGYDNYECRCDSCHPDWCNDLNAMREAEATLSLDRLYKMEAYLKQMTGAVCFRATARQRAEAFLRTLGKWEEVQG